MTALAIGFAGPRPYRAPERSRSRILLALLNLARDMVADAITGGASYTRFNNANARLGVGNSNVAFNAAHTGLQGGSTAFKAMDATYPSRASNVVTYRSTFTTAEANFAWEEIVVDNGTNTLSRTVSSLGTKTAAASWVLTHTQTWVLV